MEVVRRGVFTLDLKGGNVSELVYKGQYDWGSDAIASQRFLIQEYATTTRTIELLDFGYSPIPKKVLAEFNRRGLERPTCEDALYFGMQYPEEQRKRPIVFFHEPVQGLYGRHRVLVLGGSDSKRIIYLHCFTRPLHRHCVFAGVRNG